MPQVMLGQHLRPSARLQELLSVMKLRRPLCWALVAGEGLDTVWCIIVGEAIKLRVQSLQKERTKPKNDIINSHSTLQVTQSQAAFRNPQSNSPMESQCRLALASNSPNILSVMSTPITFSRSASLPWLTLRLLQYLSSTVTILFLNWAMNCSSCCLSCSPQSEYSPMTALMTDFTMARRLQTWLSQCTQWTQTAYRARVRDWHSLSPKGWRCRIDSTQARQMYESCHWDQTEARSAAGLTSRAGLKVKNQGIRQWSMLWAIILYLSSQPMGCTWSYLMPWFFWVFLLVFLASLTLSYCRGPFSINRVSWLLVVYFRPSSMANRFILARSTLSRRVFTLLLTFRTLFSRPSHKVSSSLMRLSFCRTILFHYFWAQLKSCYSWSCSYYFYS